MCLAGDKLTAILANNAWSAEICANAVHDIIAFLISLLKDSLTNPVWVNYHAAVDPCAFLITYLGPVGTIRTCGAETCVKASHDVLEASELSTFVVVHRR